jgi:hypothetical protein
MQEPLVSIQAALYPASFRNSVRTRGSQFITISHYVISFLTSDRLPYFSQLFYIQTPAIECYTLTIPMD